MKRSLALVYFFINVFCATLIFYFEYQVAALAKLEERKYYDAVDSITFFTQAYPVLVVCLFINFVWLLKAIFEVVKCRSYYASAWFGVAIILWIVSVLAIRLIS